MLEPGGCAVWWATPGEVRPEHRSLLDPSQLARVERLRRAEDRARTTLASALLRLAVAAVTGTAPDQVCIDRTCPRCGQAHGRPELPGTGLHASVSHSADRVAVAVSAAGPVGVDVEQVVEVDVSGLANHVLHPSERTVRVDEFFVYWTRKEAVVKATGDGLTAGLTGVRVSAPGEPAALLAYPGRPGLVADLRDLAAGPGYAAALAVLADHPVPVTEHQGADLVR